MTTTELLLTIFGWDASDFDWSRGPMDLAAARRAGIDFFTHKASEGTYVRHGRYGEAMRRARAAGVPMLGAYHVVRSPANAAAEVDYHLAYVNAATPWWRDHPGWFWQIDLEKWPYDSVPASEGEQFADIIEARTGRRAIIYASRGQYGNELSGTSHPLWNANYGDNPAVDFRTAYTRRGGDGGPGWVAYSGRTPVFWQYGSATTIGSQRTCDANAYRGTLDQLRALVRPAGAGGDDMSWDETIGTAYAPAGYGQHKFRTAAGYTWAAADNARNAAQLAVATLAGVNAKLDAIAAKVDIDPAELEAVSDAAKAGAHAGAVAAADQIAAAVVALLPDGTLTRGDVEAAIRTVLGGLDAGPAAQEDTV